MSTADSKSTDTMRPETAAARKRILDAGLRSLVRHGLESSTMAVIADEAGVSKALLHYHFVDRATLLAEIAALIARRTVSRQAVALDRSTPARAVDSLWEWTQVELERGELGALLALGTLRDASIVEAVSHANRARLGATIAVVTRVFEGLALEPRIPVGLIAGACVAVTDGLVSGVDAGESRGAFDAFWLGMLGLAD